MKEIASTIILIIVLALPCLAQDKGESEIAASYAVMPTENPLSTLWLGFSGFDALANKNFTVRRGALFGSYKYFVSNRIGIGAMVGFNGNVDKSIFWFRDLSGHDARIVTIAGEMTGYFVKKPRFKLYAMAGLGFYTMRSSLDNYTTSTRTYGPTTQLTVAGVRFGKKLSVFTELGYGYKGIINTGFSTHF